LVETGHTDVVIPMVCCVIFLFVWHWHHFPCFWWYIFSS
jgi:phosphatidylglycerophosphate synthase